MRILFYTTLIVVLDQVSKYLVRQNLTLHGSVSVLGDFFRLTYVENAGIAFGISVGGALPIFTGLSILATIVIIYYLYTERNSHLALRISLALILGGALGNLIDRILYQRVVDFLDFGIGGYRFFVFNIADTGVTIGVTLYLVFSLFFFRDGDPVSINEIET